MPASRLHAESLPDALLRARDVATLEVLLDDQVQHVGPAGIAVDEDADSRGPPGEPSRQGRTRDAGGTPRR